MTTRKYKRFLFTHSLNKSLVLSFTLLLLALLVVFLYYTIGVLQKSQVMQQNNFLQATYLAQEQLENNLTDSQQLAHNIAYSSSCQKFLLSSHPETVIESMRDALDVLSYIDYFGGNFQDVILLSDNGMKGRHLANTNSYYRVIDQILAHYDLDHNLQFTQPFYSDVITEKGVDYLVYLFPVYGNIDGFRYRYNLIVGAVVYDLDALLEDARLETYSQGISILLKDGNPLSSTQDLTDAQAAAIPQIRSGQSTYVIEGITYLARRVRLTTTNLELLFLSPTGRASLVSESLPILLITLFLLLIIAVMVWIIVRVNRDIRRMVQNIQLAETATRVIPDPYFNELVPVSQSLNKTFASLAATSLREQQLISDSYEALLAQTQAEMLAYRSQINPHFLFNTLESVRSLAHHHGVQPIEDLIGGMSQMFRYSLYAPMIVPLSAEIEHLKGYLSVVNTRFPGRYQTLWQLAPETLNLPVPSMILQPLMENTTKHAFQGRLHGTVLVQSFLRGEYLMIRLADNGVGMSEERQAALQDHIYSNSGEPLTTAGNAGPADALSGLIDRSSEDISIGLTNIYRRLTLYFNKKADLTIRSKEEYYTVVELKIPLTEATGAAASGTDPAGSPHQP